MKPSKKLIAEWNKKLRDDGFKDIESPIAKRIHSKDSTWYFESQWDATTFARIQRYYQLAGRHLHTYKWDSIKDKTVWRLHADGYTVREIEDKTGISRMTVQRLLEAIRKTIKVD